MIFEIHRYVGNTNTTVTSEHYKLEINLFERFGT